MVEKKFLFSIYDLLNGMKRFPMPFIMSFLLTISLIANTSFTNRISLGNGSYINLELLSYVIALSIPAFLGVNLLFEKFKKTVTTRILMVVANILIIILLILYQYFLFRKLNQGTMYIYLALFSAVSVFALCIPFFYRRIGLELYTIYLLMRALAAALYSIAIFLGFSVIVFTLNQLLNTNIDATIYMDFIYFSFGTVFMWIFISCIPDNKTEFYDLPYNVIIKVLLLYIIMPLASIYTAILYMYFGNIIYEGKWPDNIVIKLILGYSILTTVVVYFARPLYRKNKWVYAFSFIIPKMIIPLIGAMFFSMYIRVINYGITEIRYYVVLAGLFILGAYIYWGFSRRKNNALVLFYLAFLFPISAFGPWSALNVSLTSQNYILEDVLKKNDMIVANKMVKAPEILDGTDRSKIRSILEFFKVRDSMDKLKYKPEWVDYLDSDKIFEFDKETSIKEQESKFVEVSLKLDLYDVYGYDWMCEVENDTFGKAFSIGSGEYIFSYDNSTNSIIIFKDSSEIYRKDISEVLKNV